MPVVSITVVDPPSSFAAEGPGPIELWLDEGRRVPPTRLSNGDLVFEVEFEVVSLRDGTRAPKGPAVRHHGDKRRFVYLDWTRDGVMFRRIKVFFDTFLIGERERYSVSVAGRDRKGGPACATATVLSAG